MRLNGIDKSVILEGFIKSHTMKKPYQTPRLFVHGTLAQLTHATRKGVFLDKTLPANTPVADLNIPNSLETDVRIS